VVGEQAQGDVAQLAAAEALAGDRLGLLDQRRERVGRVEAVAAGHRGQDALEAGARVDVLAGQVGELAVGAAQVLGEDQVPDLDVALLGRRVGRSALGAELRPVVPEDLGAGAARARVAHLPEVVPAQALYAVAREADLVDPQALGLVVALVHGDPQAVAVELEHLGDELPGPDDRLAFEVVAEAEVAQHLEEAEVPGRAADGVEVVVLAAGPDAALDGGRPGGRPGHGLLAEEIGDERHHARVGEHGRAGVRRDQAARRDDRVLPGGEEVGPGAAQLGGGPRCHKYRSA
jgi:hypothetical protein